MGFEPKHPSLRGVLLFGLTEVIVMDTWKYFDITHKHHLFCNPFSKTKFERFCSLLKLQSSAHVLDIACGKGEYLVRLAEIYGISGVGVDISPFCINDCRKKHRERIPEAHLEFVEMDGARYQPGTPELFDVSMCLGASWVFKGHRGTLKTLRGMTKHGGLVIVGEPFWLKEPEDGYLEASQFTRDSYRSHEENITIGEEEELTILYTIVSNKDDWDQYEALQWWAVEDYIQSHPDDPDNKELLERTKKSREIYLRWGRDTMNWAIYIFRK
ncbi:MAG: SAM-dependent methyltransferase [Candidatus Thorarchaeota archaeon]